MTKSRQTATIPLIVAGPPRSGTRFITNVLNKSPAVMLHGEIPEPMIRKLNKLVKVSDRIYLKNREIPDRVKEKWRNSKPEFIFSAWAHLCKSRAQPKRACIYYGYKSPWHERYFSLYNSYFAPVKPRFVCCIRSFEQHLLSVKARWPNRPTPKIAARYVFSLRQIRRMKENAPDDVILFFLDDYITLGGNYLVEQVFAPLGIDDFSSALEQAARGPVNTAVQHGVKRRPELSSMQRLFLTTFPLPVSTFNSLRADFSREAITTEAKPG